MNRSHTLARTLFACVAGGAMLLAGCGDDSTTNPGTTVDSTIAPKQGASYTYTYQRLDNDSLPAGSSSTMTDSVIGTSATIDGKSNVHAFRNGLGTFYYFYEANGNVSVNADANFLQPLFDYAATYPLKTAWFTLPIATSALRRDTLVSTQSWNNGTINGLPLTIYAESEQVGTEKVTVGSESLNAVKLYTKLVVREASLQYTLHLHWTFVPKIGYFTIHNQHVKTGPFGGAVRTGGFLKTMTSYRAGT